MSNEQRPVAVVLGSDEIGSAVAATLHRLGWAVVLIDEVDPAGTRRGMSFTDAWYVGRTRLDGVDAMFCASVRSIPTIHHREQAIAATTWSWRGVAAALLPEVLVDVRTRRHVPLHRLIGAAASPPWVVGVGPGFVIGEHVDIAVETVPGPALGRVVAAGGATTDRSSPPPLGGAGAERFVYATESGRFSSTRTIGEFVRAGEHLGFLGRKVVRAPIAGALVGLAARGARAAAGDPIVEVDPRGDPLLCFGITPGARSVAQGVVDALTVGRAARPAACLGT